MTAAVKHMARKKPGTAGAATPAQPRNSQLRERFPARPAQAWWPGTAQDEGETLRWLTSPPFLPEVKATRAGRRRGTAKMLRWLSSFPGDTWQQRWEASSAEGHPGSSWVQLPLGWLRGKDLAASYDANDLSSGLLMLICGDVIRPGLAWMVTRAHKHLAPVMEAVRDPGGFARLRELAESGPTASSADARLAATRIATLLACKGGLIRDITVGDCVEMADTQRRVHSRGGQKKVDFYLRLHVLGVFPADAPATIRAFGLAQGQLTIGELVDRYRLQCEPVRDLIVDYLRERQPALDYASLDAISSSLARRFWGRIEALSPGISTLRLPPETARAWKEDLQTIKRTVTGADGRPTMISSPRLNSKDELLRVRAFYLDIAQWATEEPARWAQWAVPCPVSDAEISRAKDLRRRKARMDQRTRERLPVLPVLVRTAAGRKTAAARRLQDARKTQPGATIPGTSGMLRKAVTPKANGRHVWAEDTATGKRRNLSYEEEEAFWAFAAIEVLRLTGPLRGTARADPPQHHRVPAALDRRARPAAADRPVQDRHRTAAARQPRARRRAVRHHQPAARARRNRPADSFLRRPGKSLEPADAAAVPARDRQREPRVHPHRDPQAAHQRARHDRAHRRRRRPAHVLAARLPPDLRDRRHHERPAAAHRPGHLRPQEHRHHDRIQGRLSCRGDRGAPGVHRPPPRHPAQRGIPYSDRRGMGRVPRALREAEGVRGHMCPRIRDALRP